MFSFRVIFVGVIACSLLQQGLTTEECDGLSIGKTLQDPEDCHGYLLCHGKQTIQQFCPQGQKYDLVLGTCVVGKCPPCNCQITTTTIQPTTTTAEPTTTTAEPTTTTAETTAEPTTTTSSTAEPTTTTAEPTTTTSSTAEPTTTSSSTTEPTTTTSSTAEPTTTTSSTAEPTTTPSSATEPTPSTASTSTSTANPGPSVDCKSVPDGSFFADVNHCRNYYVCRNGQPVLLRCQWGMWFDDVNYVCNMRYLVKCPANID